MAVEQLSCTKSRLCYHSDPLHGTTLLAQLGGEYSGRRFPLLARAKGRCSPELFHGKEVWQRAGI